MMVMLLKILTSGMTIISSSIYNFGFPPLGSNWFISSPITTITPIEYTVLYDPNGQEFNELLEEEDKVEEETNYIATSSSVI